MKTRIVSLLILLSASFIITESCNNTTTKNAEAVLVDSVAETKALTLLKSNCFSCHNPDMNTTDRVAPPMFKVREHYLGSETTREQFVADIQKFLNHPSEENAKMPGAIRNFGLMPKMTVSEEDSKLIAEYIYATDLASEEWHALWSRKKDKLVADTAETFEKKGLRLAMSTKAILGKNLMQAIKQKEPEHAVEFCNTKALHLTDSMSAALNASIKRVSDKPRNKNNKANEQEEAFITKLKTLLANGEKPVAETHETADKVIGYYAIETNKMCLQCHGVKDKDINAATLSKINSLYPDDKATGYAENQIRGIWVVEMKK
ncbi:MAG: DUF3365 domain-containing protein [Bacteroidia bacterium]